MLSGRTLRLVMMLALVVGCTRQPEPAPVNLRPMPSLTGKPAPSLEGALTWLNSPEVKLESLRGKITVLHFFDYSCVNCIRTYPYLLEWHRRYAPLGLQMVGVHAPQYEFAMDPVNVYLSIKRYALRYPVAVDSHLKIAEAYKNRFWPRMLIIDKDGLIRFDYTGEGGYADAEAIIQALLREGNPNVNLPPLFPPVHDFDEPGTVCYPITPELYLGRLRGQLANMETASTNSVITFRLPEPREEGKIYANGDWAILDEYMRHTQDKEHLEDCLTLKYRATELNIVMKPEGVFWMQVFVEQDGQPIPRDSAGTDISYDPKGHSYVKVDEARMYNLTRKQPYGAYEVRLSVRGKGLSVYSFSFGTCIMPNDAATLRPAS